MSFAAAWGLLGLAALPLVWWFHRRLRRPPEVTLPALIFVQDEADARSLPRGRRVDAELLLALAATALLALAAAGPSFVQSQPRRVVRVVVSGGGAARRTAYLRDVEATLASIRASLDPDDRVDVAWLPGGPDGDATLRRPSNEALLAAAGAGRASARLVIADRPAPAEAAGVTWVSVGSPEAMNLGIVAVAVPPTRAAPELFVTLAWHGPQPARGELALVAHGGRFGAPAAVPFEVPADGYRSLRMPLAGLAGADAVLTAWRPDGEAWDDDLTSDDEVALRHGPPLVCADPHLPDALVKRLELALRAVLGTGGYRLVRKRAEMDGACLVVRPRGRGRALDAPVVLEVEPVPEGAQAERAPPGSDGRGQGPVARDLSSSSADWIYAAGAARVAPEERPLLVRRAGGRAWPVLLRAGSVVRLAPDPLRGEPRPVDTPFWPLLVENLLRAGGGAGIGGGYRAVGLLDAESSRPGRVRTPLAARTLAVAAPCEPGRSRPLRPLLIVAALACLGLLWAAPRLRRGLGSRGRARAKAHARVA